MIPKPVKVTFNRRSYVYRFHGFTIFSKNKLTYPLMCFKYNEALRMLSYDEATEVLVTTKNDNNNPNNL